MEQDIFDLYFLAYDWLADKASQMGSNEEDILRGICAAVERGETDIFCDTAFWAKDTGWSQDQLESAIIEMALSNS